MMNEITLISSTKSSKIFPLKNQLIDVTIPLEKHVVIKFIKIPGITYSNFMCTREIVLLFSPPPK